jgi:hypothetical protein
MNEPTISNQPAPQSDESEAKLVALPRDIAASMRSLRTKIQTKAEAKAEANSTQAYLWETLSLHLQKQIGEGNFRRWFEPTTATTGDDKQPHGLQLAFPTSFKRDWIEAHYGDLIRALWRGMKPSGIVDFAVMPSPPEAPKTGEVIPFPQWGDDRRAAMQAAFRSALFPALNKKQPRRFLEAVHINSVEGVDIFFTGQQFDQSDLDVYLEILNIAKVTLFGIECSFSAYSLLKALGRKTGGDNHRWLHAVLIRLRSGTVDMTDHKVRFLAG